MTGVLTCERARWSCFWTATVGCPGGLLVLWRVLEGPGVDKGLVFSFRSWFHSGNRRTFLLMKISVAKRRVWLHTDNKSRGSGTVMSSLISVPGPRPGIPVGPVASAGPEGNKPVTPRFYYIHTPLHHDQILLHQHCNNSRDCSAGLGPPLMADCSSLSRLASGASSVVVGHPLDTVKVTTHTSGDGP